MTNEENEFLAGLDKTEENPFSPEPENLFGQEPEKKDEEEVEEEEKPLPFHKDPKVQRYIQKELDKKLKDIQPTVERQFIEEHKDEADEVQTVLERIIGNDTPEKIQAVKDFKKILGSLEEKGAQRALSQLAEQEALERQEEAQASEEIEQGFENIEETFNVDLSSNAPQARKTRNDFIDFVKRVAPKDEDGNVVALPDLVETFDTFQALQTKPTNTRAKEIANRSMTRSANTPAADQPKDISWRTVDKIFGKL